MHNSLRRKKHSKKCGKWTEGVGNWLKYREKYKKEDSDGVQWNWKEEEQAQGREEEVKSEAAV